MVEPQHVINQPSLDDIKKFERKIYLVCLGGAALGAALLAIVWKSKGIWATIGGIAGILLMLIGMILFGFFFDTFYKVKAKMRAEANMEIYQETYIQWPAWFVKWGRTTLLIVLCVVWRFASMHENDFGGNTFVWHSIAGGVIIGLILYNLVRLQSPKLSANPNMSAEIGFYIVIGFVYLFLVFGPMLNRHWATSNPVCREYKLIKAGSKYIHISNNGKKERFEPPRSFTKSLGERSAVVLCIRKGYFGYEFVESFQLPDGSLKTNQDSQK